MNNLECPACGSRKIKNVDATETRQLTLGSEFTYKIPLHVCETCEEEGDFSGGADKIRELAIEHARECLAKELINSISETGMKLAYVERAFELPQRTISSKWGTGKISASGLALLRIAKSMPWIVHIADHKFSKDVIKNTVHTVWENILHEQNIPVTYSATDGSKRSIHVELTTNSNQKNRLTNFDLDLAVISTE